MSDSLRSHGLQHPRLPGPSSNPRASSNSCPSSQWCYPTISSSFVHFSSCLQPFPASGSFPMSQFFTSGAQSIAASASLPVLSMNIQDWSPLQFTGLISMQSKGLARVFSNTTVQKNQFFSTELFLCSNFHIHTWLLEKPYVWLWWHLLIMSLLFNILSRLLIAFLPRCKCLNFMTAVTICCDFAAQENKVCHCFPIYLLWSDGTRYHDLSFLNVEF